MNAPREDRLPALLETIDQRMPSFQSLLPPNIPVVRFVSAVKTALMTVPDLTSCTKQSIILACLRCASDGLVPDGRDAVLVVGKTRSGEKVAQYWQMVQGMQKIVYRSGRVVRLEARTVHAADQIAIEYGTNPGIKHIPAMTQRGAFVGAYGVATMRTGEMYVEWMDKDEIDAIMRRSKSWDRDSNRPKGPWATDYAEMARKTVLRRATKYLPTENLGHDQDMEPAAPGSELAVVRAMPSRAAVPGGEISSGAPQLTEQPVDEIDPLALAEAEQLAQELNGEILPPDGPAEVPTSRKQQPPSDDEWRMELNRLEREVAQQDTPVKVEEAWMEWDAGFEKVPTQVTADAKAIVEARLYTIGKGG